jgi:hypothetical protein
VPGRAGHNQAVAPEQRRLLRAIARSVPWALAAILATAGLCLVLGAPRWATSILVPAAALAAVAACTRDDWRALRGGPGGSAPSRGAMAVAVAHLVLPIVGVPVAIEGLRTHDRSLAIAGTSLLVIVVLNSAVLLPWRTARRQKRERAGRAR